jgi:hypothetical protein
VDFEQWLRWVRLKKTPPLCLVRGQKIGRIGPVKNHYESWNLPRGEPKLLNRQQNGHNDLYPGDVPKQNGFHDVQNGHMDLQNTDGDLEQWLGQVRTLENLSIVVCKKTCPILPSGCLKHFRVWRAPWPEQVFSLRRSFPLVPAVWFLVIKVTGRS